MDLFLFALLVISLLVLFILFGPGPKERKLIEPHEPFPVHWKNILSENVSFYYHLSAEEKKQFEYKVQEFLSNVRITGIQTGIDDTDRLLVASSAIIPIFRFPNWQYTTIYEVLLYPAAFNEKFETEGKERSILGMVGTGYMEGKMILSKPALLTGFKNETDKMNTAIHEFVHLIDKADGTVDGIPQVLLQKQYSIPWLDLINKNIEEICAGSSDINPYAATNKQEFFAVVCEYFFERPDLLEMKHPQLYRFLQEIFQQIGRAS